MASAIQLGLPGAGLDLDSMPALYGRVLYKGSRFPTAVSEWSPEPITIRERNMLKVMNLITDKPEWRVKVFMPDIIYKWEKQALVLGDFTQNMFDYCIAELQDKANQHIWDDIVSVLDVKANVCKSDGIVPKELQQALKKAVALLEDIPDIYKDWHPGSDGKVLNLIHPSLFPLIYGRSRIVTRGKVGVGDAFRWVCKGRVLPPPAFRKSSSSRNMRNNDCLWSQRFQWLPCNVELTDNDGVRIASYVNNLHPIRHRQLYRIIEKLIVKAIPMWETALSDLDSITSNQHYRVMPSVNDISHWLTNALLATDDAGLDRLKPHGVDMLPDARPYPGPYKSQKPHRPFNLREAVSANGKFQVIVKLANVHLTPAKPNYEGGSWHVEGMLNEHICAAALYYYDNENITDSHLQFRQRAAYAMLSNEGLPSSNRYYRHRPEGPKRIFGIDPDTPAVQELGRVLTQEGRMLAFPNVLQHRVAPFELVDKTRPGHRKILALFLVDPAIPIISTANVPPQQRDWWGECLKSPRGPLRKLPTELQDHILQYVDDFPISLDEAKRIRREFMNERTAFVAEVNDRYQWTHWNFCEH